MLIKATDIINDTTEQDNMIIDKYVNDRKLDNIIGCIGYQVFEDFIEFCKENNIETSLNNNSFRCKLLQRYNLKTKVMKINKKVCRVIIKK